jgi:hypothetical protein
VALNVKPGFRIAAGAAGLAAIVLTAVSLVASAAEPRVNVPAKVPAKDSLTGTISAATGAYAGDSGRASITLAPSSSMKARRSLMVSLKGDSCAGRPSCLKLRGTLKGTITAEAGRVRDVGASFTLALKGSAAPLGSVRATGTVNGTGFIARGRETARITLKARHGNVTITAQSAPVRGFTSP